MTRKRSIVISEKDYHRLRHLFATDLAVAFSDKPYLQALRGELDLAQVVRAHEVPPDVVTMNSVVRLRPFQGDEVETYTLVYPHEADIAVGKLSVLAPIGTAILGYRVGDCVEWQVPSGRSRFTIEELLFQPNRDAPTGQAEGLHAPHLGANNWKEATSFPSSSVTLD